MEGAVFNVGNHVAALDWAPSLNGAQALYLAVSVLRRPCPSASALCALLDLYSDLGVALNTVPCGEHLCGPLCMRISLTYTS